MKIIFITHYSGFYGANRSLLKLICELKEFYNIEALVIIPSQGTFVSELEKEGIHYKIFKYFNWQNIKSSVLKTRIKIILNYFLFFNIARLLKRGGIEYDIIHTNTSITNLGGYLSKKLKKPHLWHIREFGKLDFNSDYYCGIHKAGKFYNENANIIIAISEVIKKYYKNYIFPEKIKVIYNGVRIDSNYQRHYNFDHAINIAFVGVITSNKNQLEAIKACQYLLNEKKTKEFVLTIIGDGPDNYYQKLVDYVDQNDLSNNVKFIGYVNNIESVLDKIDIGLVCSKNEAFGRVTVEFMSKKIPVIASNAGANPEIIDHEETGFLYELGNYKELGEFIHKLIHNRQIIKNIGDQGYKKALSKFSSELNSKNIYNLYRDVLEN